MKNVGIIAPSGHVEEFEKLYEAEKFLSRFDINVKFFKSCSEKFRYMAGSDELRLQDLHSAFLDPEIDTIICARGGYGAIRLLDKIDYSIIKNNPKKFVGSSDITALLVSIYKNAGLVTYHAKMALNGLSKMGEREFLKYKNAIEKDFYQMPKFHCSERVWKQGGLYPGDGAVLWGGNLATIVSLFGSATDSYIPNDDIVLFLEDINEPDYKIDRMLTQILRNKPLKDKIKGVIFGEFISKNTETIGTSTNKPANRCTTDSPGIPAESTADSISRHNATKDFLNEILKEFTDALNVPYAFDRNITHGENNTIVPVGMKIL